jgi:uncharacterized membrane protein
MDNPQREAEEKRFEKMVSLVLRTGVVVSSLVVLIGGILYLTQSGSVEPAYRTFHREPANLCELKQIVLGVFTSDTRNWMQFGLLLLVATPVARVVLSVITFIRERDRTYIVLTLIVLCVLIFGFVGY